MNLSMATLLLAVLLLLVKLWTAEAQTCDIEYAVQPGSAGPMPFTCNLLGADAVLRCAVEREAIVIGWFRTTDRNLVGGNSERLDGSAGSGFSISTRTESSRSISELRITPFSSMSQYNGFYWCKPVSGANLQGFLLSSQVVQLNADYTLEQLDSCGSMFVFENTTAFGCAVANQIFPITTLPPLTFTDISTATTGEMMMTTEPITATTIPEGEFTTPAQLLTSLPFQLHLLNVFNCEQWIGTDSIEKRAEIIQEIVRELNTRCQCNFEASFISNAGFQCFPASPNAVTFRARLSGSEQATASDIIQHLEAWITSGPAISVQALLLRVNSSCSVRISSFGEQECQVEAPTSLSCGSTCIIAGTVVGVVVIVLIVATSAVIIVILLSRKKSAQLQLTSISHGRTSGGSSHSLAEEWQTAPQKQKNSHLCDTIDVTEERRDCDDLEHKKKIGVSAPTANPYDVC